MSVAVKIKLSEDHKVAAPFDEPSGCFYDRKGNPLLVKYTGGGEWGAFGFGGHWFEIEGDGKVYQATGIAFKAKKDSHLWLPPRDSSGQEVPQPITVGAFEADVNISVCARQADWTTAPPSIDWGINVHGGGRIQDYEYLLRVRGPGGEEFVIDPEIHLMKA